MSQPEQEPFAPALSPLTNQPLRGADALAALEAATRAYPTSPDLVVSAAPPPPLGRSYAFDFPNHEFVMHGSGPRTTRGEETLKGWVEKAIYTARGAHPVHPPSYGIEGGTDDFFGGPVGQIPASTQERIRNALLFHPRIADVRDFKVVFDPNDSYAIISLTVVLDDEVQTVPLTNITVAF